MVGAVEVRDSGRERLYRVNGRALKPINDWVKPYEHAWAERFDELDEVLWDLKAREEAEWGTAGSGTAKVTLPARSDSHHARVRRNEAPVYRAYTEPELVSRCGPGGAARWLAARSTCASGGRWRYVMTANEG